jgi:hypothetical protein
LIRDYDDYDDENVRLYTPVLQRVIILAGVIIAVPVVMWTITTFVRSYVARPNLPALAHVASTSASVPVAAVAPAIASPTPINQSAPLLRSDATAARETPNSPADIQKGAVNLAALPDSSASSAASTNPSAAPPEARPAETTSSVVVGSAATAPGDGGNAAAATTSLPRISAAPRSTDNVAPSGAPSSVDRGLAWPNPNTANPPDFAASRLPPPAPAPSPSPATHMASAEIMPADEPIRGRVPLPRQRPGILTVAATTPASGGGVPMPRMRPTGAPAEAAGTLDIHVGGRSDLDSPR